MARIRCLVVAAAFAASSQAASDPLRCQAAKLVAAGHAASDILRCHAKAAKVGGIDDPACTLKANAKLLTTFTRLDTKSVCLSSGDEAVIEDTIRRMIFFVRLNLPRSPDPSVCSSIRLKETARVALTMATVLAQNKLKPDPERRDAKLTVARTRWLDAFEAALKKGDCLADDITALSVTEQFITEVMNRLFAQCQDGVRGPGEECDINDAPTCFLQCNRDCTCPHCGDGKKNRPSEQCDGSDSTQCPGRCQADCTCPTPVCGNDIKETGEQCDGTDASACAGLCQGDCTCPAPVCGNGVVEQGEECDGSQATCEPFLYAGCQAPTASQPCHCCVADGNQCAPGVPCCSGAGCYLIGPNFYRCSSTCIPSSGPCDGSIPCCTGICFPSGPGTFNCT